MLLLVIACTWAAPWVLGENIMSTGALGWTAVVFDTIFISAPCWVLYEVISEWHEDNVERLGSLSMNLVGFFCGSLWVVEWLLYIPSVQLAPSNCIGAVAEGIALLLRLLKTGRCCRGAN